MIPLIYIAGPFAAPTNYDLQRNVMEAERAGLRVACNGGLPIIPHTMNRNFFGQLTEAFWRAGMIELLRRCDGLYMLPTWENSEGAKAERLCAIEYELPVYYERLDWRTSVPDLTDWIKMVGRIRAHEDVT
jgi:hypothetical protein